MACRVLSERNILSHIYQEEFEGIKVIICRHIWHLIQDNQHRIENSNECYFTIVLQSVDEDLATIPSAVADVLNNCWRDSAANVFILTKATINSEAHLHTFFPYDEHNCGTVNPTITNVYRNGDFVPALDVFKNKFGNMHGCRFTIATTEYVPMVIVRSDGNGGQYLDGADGLTVNMVANTLNFTLNVVKLPGIGFGNSWGELVRTL